VGVCSAGRIGTVATVFGFAPAVVGDVIWACAQTAETSHINVAASIDLMTNPAESH
jgi:hypothetical protein